MLWVFDAFLPWLMDANSKVNLHALEAFSNMVPLLGDLLLPIVTSILETLVPSLASKQATIGNFRNSCTQSVSDVCCELYTPV